MIGLKNVKNEYYNPIKFIRTMESQHDLFSAVNSDDPKELIDYILNELTIIR